MINGIQFIRAAMCWGIDLQQTPFVLIYVNVLVITYNLLQLLRLVFLLQIIVLLLRTLLI